MEYTLSYENELEFYKFQLNFLLNSKKVLFKNSQLLLIAYFIKYGMTQGIKEALKDELYLSEHSIRNLVSKWKVSGLLQVSNGKVIVNPAISLMKDSYTLKVNVIYENR